MQIGRVSTSHIQAVTGSTFIATLTSLLFGYCTAVICGVVEAVDHNFIAPRGLGAAQGNLLLGFAVCSALLGTIVGALSARRVVEAFGRRRPMIFAAVLFLVSAFGSAFPEIGFGAIGSAGADGLWPFIFYRMLAGVAFALASTIAPSHVAEFAPSAVRGQLGAYQQIAIAGGICIALFVNWGIALQGSDEWVLTTGWRYMMVAVAVPSFAFLWLSFTVPESPSWLVRKGRIEDARRTLARSADPVEVQQMLGQIASDNQRPAPVTPLLAFGARVVLVGIALNVLQQLIGLNAISYYGPQILQRMGMHMDAAFLGVLIARSLNMLATMLVVLVVDRVGRRPLLIGGALTMGVSMMVIGSVFQDGGSSTLGLVAMCTYLTGLGISFGPIVWIMLSEMYPPAIRAQAMTMAVAAQWGANLLVAASFPVIFGDAWLNDMTGGGAAFYVYAGFALLAAFVVAKYVPETKGVDHDSVGSLWQRQEAPVRATV